MDAETIKKEAREAYSQLCPDPLFVCKGEGTEVDMRDRAGIISDKYIDLAYKENPIYQEIFAEGQARGKRLERQRILKVLKEGVIESLYKTLAKAIDE